MVLIKSNAVVSNYINVHVSFARWIFIYLPDCMENPFLLLPNLKQLFKLYSNLIIHILSPVWPARSNVYNQPPGPSSRLSLVWHLFKRPCRGYRSVLDSSSLYLLNANDNSHVHFLNISFFFICVKYMIVILKRLITLCLQTNSNKWMFY